MEKLYLKSTLTVKNIYDPEVGHISIKRKCVEISTPEELHILQTTLLLKTD